VDTGLNPVLYDLILHAGIPLASATIAGGGAYFGVKFAIKDHANRLDLIVNRQMWVIRKIIAMGTQHNINHPDQAMNMNDFPEDTGGAFRM